MWYICVAIWDGMDLCIDMSKQSIMFCYDDEVAHLICCESPCGSQIQFGVCISAWFKADLHTKVNIMPANWQSIPLYVYLLICLWLVGMQACWQFVFMVLTLAWWSAFNQMKLVLTFTEGCAGLLLMVPFVHIKIIVHDCRLCRRDWNLCLKFYAWRSLLLCPRIVLSHLAWWLWWSWLSAPCPLWSPRAFL